MNYQRYLISTLLVVLAYQAADLSWKIIAPASVHAAVGVAPKELQTSIDTRVDLIMAADLLGAVEKKGAPRPVAKVAPQVVKTRHNVKLIGIVHSADATQSVAILVSNNQQAAYAPGDALNLGRTSTLLEVQQDRVVIEVDGQREYIELMADRSTAAVISTVPSRAVADEPLPSRIDLNDAEFKSIVGDYREKILTDPLSFSRFVQISPYVENNRVIGYQLNAGRDGRLFKTLGLQPGDLVTHINNIDLSKPENIGELIALVTAGGSVPVGIRRGDEHVEIDVEL